MTVAEHSVGSDQLYAYWMSPVLRPPPHGVKVFTARGDGEAAADWP